MLSWQQQTGVLETIGVPLSLDRNYAKLWLNHGKIHVSASDRRAHLNCSSTNHFLSLSEHFSAWPGACGVLAAGCGKVQWPAPPQWPFCAAENFRSRLRRFSFLAVTA